MPSAEKLTPPEFHRFLAEAFTNFYAQIEGLIHIHSQYVHVLENNLVKCQNWSGTTGQIHQLGMSNVYVMWQGIEQKTKRPLSGVLYFEEGGIPKESHWLADMFATQGIILLDLIVLSLDAEARKQMLGAGKDVLEQQKKGKKPQALLPPPPTEATPTPEKKPKDEPFVPKKLSIPTSFEKKEDLSFLLGKTLYCHAALDGSQCPPECQRTFPKSRKAEFNRYAERWPVLVKHACTIVNCPRRIRLDEDI